MAIPFECPCGRQLRVKDELAGKKVRCPECGDAVCVPTDEAEAEPAETLEEAEPEEDSKKARKARRRKRRAEDEGAEAGGAKWLARQLMEQAGGTEGEARRKRKLHRSLGRVRLGLGFHVAAILFLFAGLWLLLGSGFYSSMAGSRDAESAVKQRETALSLRYGGVALVLIGAGLETPAGILCLQVPAMSARLLLIGSLLSRLLVFTAGGLLLFGVQTELPLVSLLLFAMALGWVLWMVFLGRVAHICVSAVGKEITRFLIAFPFVLILQALSFPLFVALLILRELIFALVLIFPLVGLYFAWWHDKEIRSYANWLILILWTGIPTTITYLSVIKKLRDAIILAD